MVTPERKVEIVAELIATNPRRPRPVLVVSDGKIVGDAVVNVCVRDPNWWRHRVGTGFNGTIIVRYGDGR